MQGHPEQYPETQFVNNLSQQCCSTFKSCNICVLKPAFFLTFLHRIQFLGLLPLATTPTHNSPTKVTPQSMTLLLCLQPTVWKP